MKKREEEELISKLIYIHFYISHKHKTVQYIPFYILCVKSIGSGLPKYVFCTHTDLFLFVFLIFHRLSL